MNETQNLGKPEALRYTQRQEELRRMRIFAAALLVVMAVVFVGAKYLETRVHINWGFLRAFAEAGMIGG
ncbi:MAG: hypothetical protein KAZ17_03110, partial [Sphingorhabdus sp.]|nr:hypothetical protein [Sphingorhabdus sp.]